MANESQFNNLPLIALIFLSSKLLTLFIHQYKPYSARGFYVLMIPISDLNACHSHKLDKKCRVFGHVVCLLCLY